MNMQQLDLSIPEQVMFRLRALYSEAGYTRFRMNKFEEYDLYAGHKDFLLSDNVLTFTDGDGKLMALKPDVTLSIVKSSRDDPQGLQKLYYNENVYRAARGGNYGEQMQVGLECMGAIDDAAIREVLTLAAKSLGAIREDAVLCISHLGLLVDVLKAMGIPENRRDRLLKDMGEKNLHELAALCRDCGVSEENIRILQELICVNGPPEEVLPQVRNLLQSLADGTAVKQLMTISEALTDVRLHCDFSMVGDIHYYNGILFRGFLPGLPDSVLSGGQYDNLMRKMGRSSGAVGFAVYVDRLERLEEAKPEKTMLNVALPKGRLGEKVYAMFEKAGFECPAIREPGRKLIFENRSKGVRYFWVKPSDVAIYVERGAADIGVAGKDILLEYAPDVYELLDLGLGKCKMAVAAPCGFCDDTRRPLRVATKFETIARRHYDACGREIDIIHLNGSIELAPILGLSDVIVDIVETGTTLRENHLAVIEDILPISARLVANKANFKFKYQAVQALTARVRELLERQTEESK